MVTLHSSITWNPEACLKLEQSSSFCCSDGWQALVGEKRIELCVWSRVWLVTRWISLAGCVWKSPSCRFRITRRADAIIIHSHWGEKRHVNLSWRLPNAIPSALKGFYVSFSEDGCDLPGFINAWEANHRKGLCVPGAGGRKGGLPRSCTYLTSLSVRRSYPCQIAAIPGGGVRTNLSWEWAGFCFARRAGLLNSGIFRSPLIHRHINPNTCN